MRATNPAAVLVPVVDRDEPTVLLTHRTAGPVEPCRPGRVPGGKIDPGDESPRCRRAARSQGGSRPVADAGRADRLSRSLPDLFGLSHPADGGARQAGLHADAQSERGHRGLRSAARLSDGCRTNHQRKTRDWKGIAREYYAMPFGERYIWGITAGILRNLYERIYGP